MKAKVTFKDETGLYTKSEQKKKEKEFGKSINEAVKKGWIKL